MAWFPGRMSPEMERLAEIIFVLRRELFLLTEYERSQEGVWEMEEEEKRRDLRNDEAVKEWDNETRKIIHGDKV